MKKVLLVLYNSFSEFEITVATAMLKGTHQVVTAAGSNEMITGESGLQFLPHLTFQDVNYQDYEALIIPGGDLYHIKDSLELFELTRAFHDNGKLVASICSGAFVLAKAGILLNTHYTVTLNHEQRTFLGCFDESNFKYESIVKMDNIITAQGHAYVDFALEIAEHLDALENREYAKDFYKGNRNYLMEREVIANE
ncbi:DJ-1/PfpI family protein [Ferdinandcohnia quinoae]|uniref:DJ-1/PfpI family protein n=1 Tax=Fredinandcohnia quinoae TaxID=2918902 RepID=A0AAW5EBP8_9BACI|nr:DJ-1/PfpI family protein [Fredinandcohnia sp. SECRCQ15]MCH1626876.1 DJ-1/PfpI family protein [Fredinandcohnia sp. SECRCQ15]